tara:strand:- start:615 stop:926 length:312 start_codon:yes stop_codon:yes gene_type:complete
VEKKEEEELEEEEAVKSVLGIMALVVGREDKEYIECIKKFLGTVRVNIITTVTLIDIFLHKFNPNYNIYIISPPLQNILIILTSFSYYTKFITLFYIILILHN